MIHIALAGTEAVLRIEREIWITVNRNGVVATPHRVLARGVSDGETVWSLGSLEGYPEARCITLAEYEQLRTPPDPDPELSAREALNIIMGGII